MRMRVANASMVVSVINIQFGSAVRTVEPSLNHIAVWCPLLGRSRRPILWQEDLGGCAAFTPRFPLDIVLIPHRLEHLFLLPLLIERFDQSVHRPAMFAERLGQVALGEKLVGAGSLGGERAAIAFDVQLLQAL